MVDAWNELPGEVAEAHTIATFKAHLVRYIYKQVENGGIWSMCRQMKFV